MDQPLKVIAGTPDKPLKIGDIEIPCYVLEDETRVLSQRGLQSSIGLGTGGGSRGAPRIVEFIEKFNVSGIKNTDLLSRMKSPILFQPPGGTAYGYPAILLVDICNVILQAHEAGLTDSRQEQVVMRANILIRGFASVGVIALVDEATGYQRIREENALATILERFIDDELQPWMRTFPYEFYKQIFRLKGWEGPDGVKRPKIIGRYTNDLVYDRLAPGVLKKLREINPRLPNGELTNKHHQWFSRDSGYPLLRGHIEGVMALMKVSPNWDHFMHNINIAYPKVGDNLELLLPASPTTE